MAGQDLAIPLTTSSLVQKAQSAKQVLAVTTAPSEAFKATKQLVGSYAHLKPDQPETFIASIAAVLAQYPLGIVTDCVDPRKGIARKVEFLSVAKVVEWCDTRLAFYQSLANYVPVKERPPYPELTEAERATASRFLTDLAAELRVRSMTEAIKPKAPLLTNEEISEHYRTHNLGGEVKETADEAVRG